MNSKTIDDAVFEAILRQVVIDKYHTEVNSIHSSELEKEISLSPEFELRIKKLFNRERRKSKIRSLLSNTRKVAVIAAIILTALFGVLLTNANVRAAVGKAVVEWYEKFTSITFGPENKGYKDSSLNPEDYITGYKVVSKETVGRSTNVMLENTSGISLSLFYTPSDSTANHSIDNENHTVEITDINGYEAFLAIANDTAVDNIISWNTHGYRLIIHSKLPPSELKRIAELIFSNE